MNICVFYYKPSTKPVETTATIFGRQEQANFQVLTISISNFLSIEHQKIHISSTLSLKYRRSGMVILSGINYGHSDYSFPISINTLKKEWTFQKSMDQIKSKQISICKNEYLWPHIIKLRSLKFSNELNYCRTKTLFIWHYFVEFRNHTVFLIQYMLRVFQISFTVNLHLSCNLTLLKILLNRQNETDEHKVYKGNLRT